jgi:hypothetical protein
MVEIVETDGDAVDLVVADLAAAVVVVEDLVDSVEEVLVAVVPPVDGRLFSVRSSIVNI